MRGIVAAVFALVAIGLFIGSITVNWPSSPSDWGTNSYDVSWGRYVLACVLALFALLIWLAPKIFKRTQQYGTGDDYHRLVSQGIGWRENKGRKNPWPKRQL